MNSINCTLALWLYLSMRALNSMHIFHHTKKQIRQNQMQIKLRYKFCKKYKSKHAYYYYYIKDQTHTHTDRHITWSKCQALHQYCPSESNKGWSLGSCGMYYARRHRLHRSRAKQTRQLRVAWHTPPEPGHCADPSGESCPISLQSSSLRASAFAAAAAQCSRRAHTLETDMIRLFKNKANTTQCNAMQFIWLSKINNCQIAFSTLLLWDNISYNLMPLTAIRVAANL